MNKVQRGESDRFVDDLGPPRNDTERQSRDTISDLYFDIHCDHSSDLDFGMSGAGFYVAAERTSRSVYDFRVPS